MTESEFKSFFDSVLQNLPEYARENIHAYCEHNKVTVLVYLNDKGVDLVERRDNRKYPAAIALLDSNIWQFLFRPFITTAPSHFLKAIVQHELIHAFLYPYLHPTQAQPVLSAKAVSEIERYKGLLDSIYQIHELQLPPDYDREEDLTAVINTNWGGDEDAAQMWSATHAHNRLV